MLRIPLKHHHTSRQNCRYTTGLQYLFHLRSTLKVCWLSPPGHRLKSGLYSSYSRYPCQWCSQICRNRCGLTGSLYVAEPALLLSLRTVPRCGGLPNSSVLVALDSIVNWSERPRLFTMSWKTNCAMVLRQMLPWQMKHTLIIISHILLIPFNTQKFCTHQ